MLDTIYYHFVRLCNWMAHFHYVIAYSTHCNPDVTRRLRKEWDHWYSELQLIEFHRGLK